MSTVQDDFDDDYVPLRDRLFKNPWIGEVDERAYAVFRIVFSIVALANLIHLWGYREAFFTAGGMISPDMVRDLGWHTSLSVFSVVDSSLGVSICFLIAAAALVCLGLGVSPRVAAIVVFVWHISFTYRAVPGTAGWDHVLRAYSFLVMVSPLGNCWRLGCWRAIPAMVSNYGISLMRLQVLVIYWQATWFKLCDKYWQDGEFLSYFLMSMFARWPSSKIAGWHDFLIPVTYLTMLIELAIPVLLMIPKTRKVGFIIGFSFHLMIVVVAKNLFLFSLTMWMTYVAFVTPGVLDRLEWRVRRRLGR
ncbi:MAG: hypothetical protein ACI9MB_003455 [Verrucomicrobiales bacterium]|jgi:hypothetical protein